MAYKEYEEGIDYKINSSNTYKVYKQEQFGRVFYKIQVSKQNFDGTKSTFYRQVKFAKCAPVEDGAIIRIKRGFEDLYVNSKDKYNPVSVIVILEYEMSGDNREYERKQALGEFQDNLRNNEEFDATLPF